MWFVKLNTTPVHCDVNRILRERKNKDAFCNLSVIPQDTWISKFRTKSNPCFFYSNSLNKLRFHMNQIQVSCNQSSDGISKFRCSVRPSVLFVSTSLILCPSFLFIPLTRCYHHHQLTLFSSINCMKHIALGMLL